MSTRSITRDDVGKRLLLTDRITEIGRLEVEVLELSPSGENVKLRNLCVGSTFWQRTQDDVVVEELAPKPM